MISYRAVPRTSGTSIALIFHITVLIENTVVVGLLKGVPHAHFIIRTSLDAVFKVRYYERVDKVALTLERIMTFTSRTPGLGIECKKLMKTPYDIKKYSTIWQYLYHSTFIEVKITFTHSLSPLIQPGHMTWSGEPFSVQFVNKMQRFWSAKKDHQLQSSPAPQNLWQVSTSSVWWKSTLYSWNAFYFKQLCRTWSNYWKEPNQALTRHVARLSLWCPSVFLKISM